MILQGPWYGENGLESGAFAARYSVFLPQMNVDWQIPDGVGIKTCPRSVCTTPTNESFWGWINSIFSWDQIAPGLEAVQEAGLLYSLAPDVSALNQSLLAVSGQVKMGKGI